MSDYRAELTVIENVIRYSDNQTKRATSWPNKFGAISQSFNPLQCVFVMVFRDGFNAKLFARLMLTSTLIVEAVVTHRKKLAGRTH